MAGYAVRFDKDKGEKVLCPEFDRKTAKDDEEVTRLRRRHRQISKDGESICLDCYLEYGEKLQVRLKAGDKNRWHYAHLPGISQEKHDKAEAVHSGETSFHKAGMAYVWKFLMAKDAESKIEINTGLRTNAINRRPDLAQTRSDGTRHAYEVQFSKISLNQLRRRTEDLLELGFETVTWYLFDAAYTKENREYLADRHKTVFFKMAGYESDSVETLPLIQVTPGVAPKPFSKPLEISHCTRDIDHVAVKVERQPDSASPFVPRRKASHPHADWLRARGWKPDAKVLCVGALVKGTPDRASAEWTGIIVGNIPFKDGRDYWQVDWLERASMKGCSSVIGNTSDQLILAA